MKKKECPNPIIISSNMGIGNLVKETLPSAPYINPPFAFPAPKEKRKCISASAQTRPASVRMNFFIFLYLFCVRADAITGPRQEAPRPHGRGDFPLR
jgi:hypothetical protein